MKVSSKSHHPVHSSQTLAKLALLADIPKKIHKINEIVKKCIFDYEKANKLTTNDGSRKFKDKTLHGIPYDQNRLGKGQENVPGFKDFYIAGSPILMPYRNYDIMQAPIVAHVDKKDTVLDFWNSVIVLRKSPIIVTTHDPHEKKAKVHAEYWKHEHFHTPLELKNGWKLTREGSDLIIATSRHSDDIKLVKRLFIAKNIQTNEEHQVTQFHYQGWPDNHGAPDHELLERLHREVDREFETRKLPSNAPVTVHCAAGMGRSPTFAVSNHLRLEVLTRLKKGEHLDTIELTFAQTIYAFKQQRPLLLENEEQIQSVLTALRHTYLLQKGTPIEELRALEQPFESRILNNK